MCNAGLIIAVILNQDYSTVCQYRASTAVCTFNSCTSRKRIERIHRSNTKDANIQSHSMVDLLLGKKHPMLLYPLHNQVHPRTSHYTSSAAMFDLIDMLSRTMENCNRSVCVVRSKNHRCRVLQPFNQHKLLLDICSIQVQIALA